MGDQNTVLTAADARHFLRRTGFGAPPDEVARLTGLTRGAAADQALDFKPSKFKPGGRYIGDKANKWFKYMVKCKHPLQEKLVLFWHDHFACSDAKVGNAKTMALQNRLLRLNCKGNFKSFVKAINRDAAMIEFLDTVRNRAAVPNENYARELQELFTLGVTDVTGAPNYTQADIVQIARAFTGWEYDYNTGATYLDDYHHDFMADWPERGPKVIYQSTGGFGPAGRSFTVFGEGANEIDEVVEIIFAHTDSQGQNTVARYITRKLFSYFAHPEVAQSAVDAVIASSGFATSWDLSALLRAIFVHDAFYETAAAAPYTAATKKSVKWPIDFVVSTLRLLKMKLVGKYQYINGGSYSPITDELRNMGQVLFEPPSVFGWDWEAAWLSSATLLARYGFARDVTSARDGRATAFRPGNLMDLGLTDPGQIVDAVTNALGVSDQFTPAERTVLIDYLTDNGANPTLNLHDDDVRNAKLHGLFALVLQSSAFQLH